jgi:hypothetical protein
MSWNYRILAHQDNDGEVYFKVHEVFYENEHGETLRSIEWFSDYKSASSVERVEAFIKLGRKDPVQYADEFGPATWEYVKEFVSSVLDEHTKTL